MSRQRGFTNFTRAYSTSHMGFKGYHTERNPGDDGNYYWKNRMGQGNYYRGTSEVGYTQIPTPQKYKYSQRQNRQDQQRIKSTKQMSTSRHSLKQLQNQLHLRNKKIMQLESQNNKIIIEQNNNIQFIKRLQSQNMNFKQFIEQMQRNKQKSIKQTNQKLKKDEEIRKQIFIEIQKLQKELLRKQKQLSQLRKQPKQQNKILHQIKSRQDQLQEKLNRVQNTLRQQQYKAQRTIESLQKLNVQNQMQISNFQRHIGILAQELQQFKQRSLKLQFQNNSIQQEMKRTLNLFDEYRAKKQQIQIKYNKVLERVGQLEIQREKYKKQINNYKRKNAFQDNGLMNKISQLKRQNSNLKGILNNVSNNQDVNTNYNKNLSDLQMRVLKFQQRTNWLLNNQDRFEQNIQNSKVGELKQRVKSLKKQNQSLKCQVSKFVAKTQTISKCQKQIQTINRKDNNQIQSFNKRVAEQYQKRISVYVSQIQRQNYLCQQYEGRIKEYKQRLLKIKNKYQQQGETLFFKNKNIELEQRVQQLLLINTQLKEQLQKTEDTSKDLYRHQINILQQRLLNVQEKLDDLVRQNLKLKQQMTLIEINSKQNNQNVQKRETKNQKQQIKKLSKLLQDSALHIRQLQVTIQELKQIIFSHENQNHKLLQQNQYLSEQIHTSIQSDMSNSFKYLELEFEKLNQIIQSLKNEVIKVIDNVSGYSNGGETVQKIMDRLRNLQVIQNTLSIIRTHMESLQRHQRYSIVIN